MFAPPSDVAPDPARHWITSMLWVAIAVSFVWGWMARSPSILLLTSIAVLICAAVVRLASRQNPSYLIAFWVFLACPSCILIHSPYRYESAWPVVCRNNLIQISLALQNYESKYGELPPAQVTDSRGRPLHSWRVLILPFLEQQALYNAYKFDEPWNGPNNSKLHDTVLQIYCCPSEDVEGLPRTMTSYLAVVGPGTAWDPDRPKKGRGAVSRRPAKLLLVVESSPSGVHWMEPRDLHVHQMNPAVQAPQGQGISSLHPSRAHAISADGEVLELRDTLTRDEIKALLVEDKHVELIARKLWDDFTRMPRDVTEKYILAPDDAKKISEDAKLKQGEVYWARKQSQETGHCIYYDTDQRKYWVRWETQWERAEKPTGTMAGPFDFPK